MVTHSPIGASVFHGAGSPEAQVAGMSVVLGALVRCKAGGRYSWQQILRAVRQPDGCWALLVGMVSAALNCLRSCMPKSCISFLL